MNILNRLYLYNCLGKKDYEGVLYVLHSDENAIKLLKLEHIKKLIEYAENRGNIGDILILLDYMPLQKRKEVISKYWGLRLDSNCLKKYFEEFFDVAKSMRDSFDYMINLIESMDKDPKLFKEQIEMVTAYIWGELEKNNPDLTGDHIFSLLEIQSVPKIPYEHTLNNGVLDLYITYALSHNDIEELNSILDDVFSGEPNEDFIKNFLISFLFENSILDDAIYRHILQIKDKETKSRALLNYFEVANSRNGKIIIITDFDKHWNDLANEMLKLNVYQDVKALMKNFSANMHDKYCKEALEKKDNRLILTLASTTKCFTTYKLIDYILNENKLSTILTLLNDLDGEFLDYALSKIFILGGVWHYLRIVRALLVMGSPKVIPAINFILNTKLKELISIEDYQNLSNTLKEEQKRVRNHHE